MLNPRRSFTALPLAILLTVTLSGCTLLQPGPCQPRQATQPSAFIRFETGAEQRDLQTHFNETGWETSAALSGFLASKYWNDTLYLSASVGASRSAVGLTIWGGPSVLTPEEAQRTLSEPATVIGAELAEFLGTSFPRITYDGGSTHCGSI